MAVCQFTDGNNQYLVLLAHEFYDVSAGFFIFLFFDFFYMVSLLGEQICEALCI